MSTVAQIEVELWLAPQKGAPKQSLVNFVLNDVDMDLVAKAEDMSLTVFLRRLHVGTVNIVFGNGDSQNLKQKINDGFKRQETMVNAWLAGKKIQLARDLFKIFKLTQLKLDYYDDYLYIGMMPVLQ